MFVYSKVCRNGKCTAEIENIIPDYTHVTQTISRAPSQDRILSRSDTPSSSALNNRGARHHSRTFASRSGALRPSSFGNAPAPPNSNNLINKPTCRGDIVERMAGSLTCTEFLQKFGYRYCNHNYIKRNCCASHALICSSPEE